MGELNFRERELVTLGAALASNCIPCIEHHVGEARKAGLDDGEIAAAVKLADAIKNVPARKVLETATRLLEGAGADIDAATPCCAPAAAAPVAPKASEAKSCC